MRALVHRVSSFRRSTAAWALAIGLIGSMQGVHAQGVIPIAAAPSFSSGMVGLASGQTARLNVVNTGASLLSPLPCVTVLAFLDSDGQILKQMFVFVASGKAAFLDLSFSDISSNDRATPSARLPIRGISYNPLLSPGPAIPQSLACNLVPTLELFDTDTGRTSAVVTDFSTPSSLTFTPGPVQP